jgi:hypothetical protein
MSVTWSWQLQAYISGAWVDISRDVEIYKAPLEAKRGINGSGVANRIASPGSLTCSLDNGESNSAGLLGYYSPEHANMRANFGRDTIVRLKITYSGTDYYKWRGWVSDLQPTVGKFKERSSKLFAADLVQKMIEQKISMIAVQQDQRPDQIAQTLISALSTAPQTTSIETEDYSLPFALSSEQDEKTTVMAALQKLVQTSLGYVFVKGNTTNGETLMYQREKTRLSSASAATLTDTMTDMEASRNTNELKNRIVGKIHPTRVDDAATTLLYELDNEIYVDGGETRTFTFRFKDPANQAQRISALDVVTPLVADTHYRASALEDTTNNDLNGSVTITDTNGGNSAEWEIENTGGVRAYLNLVNIFGKGIYYYNPVEIVQETGAADREMVYDFFYLSDPVRARAFLQHLIRRTSSTAMNIKSVYFLADENSTLMGYAMSRDIGDRVTVVESATGISGDYIINHVTYSINTDGTLGCTWGLEAVETTSFFILNTSQLNGAHVLSPF